MRWFLPLVIVVHAASGLLPAHAQFDRATEELRQPDRPITAPGLSPDPMRFSSPLGAKPSDEVLKSLDKDLGRSTLERTESRPRDEPLEGPRYRPGEDLGKRPAAPSAF